MLIDSGFRNVLNVFSGDKALAQLLKIAQGLGLGQFLKGKVVEILPDGKAMVNIQGRNITLATDMPLARGQTVFARIEQEAGGMVLKLATTVAEAASTPARIADKNPPHRQSPKPTPDVVTRLSSPPVENAEGELAPGKTVLPGLRAGQDILVKIVNILDDAANTVRVEFQGRQFPVQVASKGDLPAFLPGESVRLRVIGEKDGGIFVAALPAAEPETLKTVDAAMIKPYLASKQDLGRMIENLRNHVVDHPLMKELKISPELLERLRDTIRFLSPLEDAVPDATRLREQVDRLGTAYEAKVKAALSEPPASEIKTVLSRDLKGQLLELQNKLETLVRGDASRPSQAIADVVKEAKDILQNIKQSVDNIEFRQLSNQFARQENNPVLMPIPDPFGDKSGVARVYLRDDARSPEAAGRDGTKDFTLVFLLDMTALGCLRMDARLHGNDLSAKIAVESQDVADFIDSRAGELQARLRDMGFNTTVSCQAREKVDMQVEDDLRRMLVEDKSRLIDIKT